MTVAYLVNQYPKPSHSFILLAGYTVLYWRVLRYGRNRGLSPSDARLYARHMVIGKFAEAQGLITFWKCRLLGRRTKLIEYKSAAHGVPIKQPA